VRVGFLEYEIPRTVVPGDVVLVMHVDIRGEHAPGVGPRGDHDELVNVHRGVVTVRAVANVLVAQSSHVDRRGVGFLESRCVRVRVGVIPHVASVLHCSGLEPPTRAVS